MGFFNVRGRETDEAPTRREVLRRMFSTGVAATAGAGLSGLLAAPRAGAATTQLPATMILNALPPDAPPSVVAAIQAGCCITYIRDENHCGAPCGTGYCCYHLTSTSCGLNEITCVQVSCAEGNFTTGC